MREFSSQMVVQGQAWARERSREIRARKYIMKVGFPEVDKFDTNERI